jgi:hypothetical protein
MKLKAKIFLSSSFFLLMSVSTHASPTPCKFVKLEATGPARYDIGAVYREANLVIIGSAKAYAMGKPQEVTVKKTIKGNNKSTVILEGMHEAGTDPWGAAIPVGEEYLMFLKTSTHYIWVEPGSCSNAFKVTNGKVMMGKEEIEIGNLKTYFESKPNPVVL